MQRPVDVAGEPWTLPMEEQLGRALELLSTSKQHARLPMIYAERVLYESIQQRNIKFYYENSVLFGIALWAFVDAATAERLSRNPGSLLAPPEWNEGETLWMVDLVAPHGRVADIWRDLRNVVFAGEAKVQYLRMRRAGFIHKKFSRPGVLR